MDGTIPLPDPKVNNTVVLPGPSGRTQVIGRVFNYNGEIHADYTFPKTTDSMSCGFAATERSGR